MRGGNYLFLVWGSINLVFVGVVEIDVVYECRPKITWFVRASKLTCFFGWSTLTFSMWANGIDFDFSVEIGIDLFFVLRSKMTCFSCLDRN